MSDSPRDVGVLLKQEREKKGIALDVVHEVTKIPLDALKAIEEGYKVRTLTAFYYKSFVKIYAQYLGLDANFIVTLIPTHHPKELPQASSLRPGSRKASSASGAGAHRVEGVRARSWNLLAHPIVLKKKKKVFKAVMIVVLVCLGVAAVVALAHQFSRGSVERPVPAASRPVLNKSVKKVAKEQRPELSKVKAAVPVAKVPAVKTVAPKGSPDNKSRAVKRVSITVRAQTSTWISVRADGAGVFQGHLKKGTASTWRGEKKIELSAKDIGALEFEVNGRNVGKLARRDLKAKKVVVTPEGLNVEK